ncbi:hypothetical protein NOC27_2792 [Nitrosococcus oceani AFC27]|nr:hypothetical protein NOC27_2792 [Nitrosococcus oceani AFC27]
MATKTYSIRRLPLRLIRLRSGFQGPIPHITGMAKLKGQLPLLRGRWVKPELVGALYYHTSIVKPLYGAIKWLGSYSMFVSMLSLKINSKRWLRGKTERYRIWSRRCWPMTQNANPWRNESKAALALRAPFHFASPLGGHRTSLYSFNAREIVWICQ